MSNYREGCIRAKAVRAGIIDPRPLATPSKKAKPVVLEARALDDYRCRDRAYGGWRKWSAYASVAEAEQACSNLARKYARLWEFRVRPE